MILLVLTIFILSNPVNNLYSQTFRTNESFIIIQNFESKYLENKRTIRVFLPDEYFTSTNYYPVLYAHDGQNIYYDEKNRSKWDIDKTIKELVKQGKIKEVIVVGIDNTGIDRIKEYTPFAYETYGGGRGEKYGKFIVEELKPFIEANFRVKTNKESVGVFGSSLGGLISLYLGIWYPEVFGTIGCISPSFWWGLETNKINITKNIDKLKTLKIYIDMGYNESRDVNSESNIVYTTREINNTLLTKIDYPQLLYIEDPKGIHNEISWKERISNFLIFALSPKTLSEEITSIELHTYPEEWGIGDKGFVLINTTTKDGIVRTIYDTPLQLEKFTNLGNGIIQAVQSGSGKITVSVGNMSYSKTINIDILSRKVGVANINVLSKASKVEFIVENEDNRKTNYTIPLEKIGNKEDNTIFFTSITNVRGKTLKGRFVLDGVQNEEIKQIIINKRQKDYRFKF